MTVKNELIQYCHDVNANRPLTCLKHKWACSRFLRDIERENTPEFPFIFTEEKAERFFNWMRLFKHRKGILAGQYIEPHIIQKFVFGNVYGWLHKETGYRRFNKMYWQIARKNAKSQSLSCVGGYELMAFFETGEETSEVYCAATKKEQSKVVYDETVAMLNKCKLLKGKYSTAYGRIEHLKTESIMRPLSEEDKKTGDGFNPQCGIIDEYHAHETSEAYDVVDSGMGARAQPLLAIITTAGFDLANPCYRVEYDLISKILNPNIPVDINHYFALVCELDKNDEGELQDDIKNPDVWVKANPIVCSYPEGVSYLQKKLEESVEAPEKMRNFLTKHMNVWIMQRESGYMNMARWTTCNNEFPDLRGKFCYVGLDLSAKIDLTSVSFEFKIDDKYFIMSHSFMPEDTLKTKQKTDKVPYGLWIKEGWLSTTSGAVVDYRAVKTYAIERAEKEGWKIAEWCLDPWGGIQISADLEDEGYTAVEIVQGIKTLSEPTKNFREMVYLDRVVHDKNPLLSWSISNAVVEKVDRNENIILSKKKSRERIDPIASVINAHVRAMTSKPNRTSRIMYI